MSPSGNVPFVKCGAFVVAEFDSIISFVNNKGVNVSSHLNTAEKADMQAYMTLVDTVFHAAELYFAWCHEDNFQEVTQSRHAFAFPWPLDKLLCWRQKRAVARKLASIGWGDKTLEEVLVEVDDCCTALSERLNNRRYFFGEKPTELDALVYGHISAILATPLPDNGLAAIIREHQKLVELCTRVAETYFHGKL